MGRTTITAEEIRSVTLVIGRMDYEHSVDARDIVQTAMLKILETGRDMCPQTVYGFARNVMFHELDRLRVRRVNAGRVPGPDYDYETPGWDGDLSPFRPDERENIEKLLRYADRNKYGSKGEKKRKRWPGYVLAYLEATGQHDARRTVARKKSTIQPKDRQ